ncbi:hypothetical protein PFISCL1PPCAC_4807, partial [Pristionchus fissidentatus]
CWDDTVCFSKKCTPNVEGGPAPCLFRMQAQRVQQYTYVIAIFVYSATKYSPEITVSIGNNSTAKCERTWRRPIANDPVLVENPHLYRIYLCNADIIVPKKYLPQLNEPFTVKLLLFPNMDWI